MSKHEQQLTPPSYRGRELPCPEDELQDQGLGFDVVTLLDRRKVLGAAGLGLLGFGLAACAAPSAGSGAGSSQASSGGASASSGSASGLAEIPDETAGPYPGDGSNGPDVLEQSGIVRSDLRSSFGESSGTAEGVPMTLELTILDLANGGGAFKDVAVYVWHCDRDGNYSMYSEAVADQNYLRGVQIADQDGVVRFTSIFPACYSGRWPHIHFEVYPDRDSITDHTKAIATSQVALPKNACDAVYATSGYESSVRTLAQVSLDSDNVFGDDSGATQLGATSGSVADGYTVKLTVPVDTRTEPSGGAAPAGGGGGQGGGPGNPPPSN
ncbi:3,4-dioxygenase subunit beta [Galactobacter valiniphilus]|uniref:3,4-dioxygenase subunit beta n=1 Tax=Galactobacter valiniphilus TaxID=2676122 RepID=A0A399JDZ8_9MICC|nr:intradiol ring-cleavage dioxygenase [Galactobacter valiniphilus]RII42787.1 3,4-dioxygenase subunit beta [Galactobacter valiniphilus]